MHIAVVGVGYVGLVTGVCFSEFGVQVTCIDQDAGKIARLRQGSVPIYEPGLEELCKKNLAGGRLHFTTDLDQAVRETQVIFIAVGTPPRGDGFADLSHVEAVARAIAARMDGYKVIVTKSTVPVGTGRQIRAIIAADGRHDFDVVSNPEFLREGSAIEDFMRPNRVVIGADSERAVGILKELYRPLYLLETPIVVTDMATAEMIKYASNAFLATKISFINEVANLCEKVGADVQQVARGMGLDGRIGAKFLHPGPGFGGSCFPKDVLALSQMARQHGEAFQIVDAVIEVNRRQRDRMVEKIEAAVGDPRGKQIAVLGLAFKPNTDDMREAPSIPIIEALQKRGAILMAYDPVAMPAAQGILSGIAYATDPYAAAEGADALILVTEWNQFRNLDLTQLKQKLKTPLFIDLRNVYNPKTMADAGLEYVSVGRPNSTPDSIRKTA